MIYILLSLSLLPCEYEFVVISTFRMPCGELHCQHAYNLTGVLQQNS